MSNRGVGDAKPLLTPGDTADGRLPEGLRPRLKWLRSSRLVRQNLILFAGGLVAGIGGFVYHAIAGRALGPSLYGDVASIIALYAVFTTPTLILVLVLARYSATLTASGTTDSVRYLVLRSTQLIMIPSALIVVASFVLAGPTADFLHLHSPVPVIWLGIGIAVYWQVGIPRGILQGIQHFSALSANLSLEMIVRCTALALLLAAGTGVIGATVSVLAGVAFAYLIGLYALRAQLRAGGEKAPLRSMVGFSLIAIAGTLGIMLLYNLDVILAKHYLSGHDAGIYGSLNKIGTILYFLTLSVSQVLFPRVVEALASNNHPGRLLGVSAGLMAMLGAGALLVFGVLPGLVVRLLFGPAFADAQNYIFLVGLIGLALSLNNLLVQFCMAARDRWFIPLLAAAVVMLAVSIATYHGGVSYVVTDVLGTMLALLAALTVRLLFLLPRLRPVTPL
ncbi:MAG: oligosaccharide flippase family protein [Candidatus Dormibacteraeota bacterium]|nr:oligosaccharide flippase family protein [Candidatus Dormibacteraeota bacterium]